MLHPLVLRVSPCCPLAAFPPLSSPPILASLSMFIARMPPFLAQAATAALRSSALCPLSRILSSMADRRVLGSHFLNSAAHWGRQERGTTRSTFRFVEPGPPGFMEEFEFKLEVELKFKFKLKSKFEFEFEFDIEFEFGSGFEFKLELELEFEFKIKFEFKFELKFKSQSGADLAKT